MKFTTYTILATSKMARAAADQINATLMGGGFSSYFENEPSFKNAIDSKIKEELDGCIQSIRDNLVIEITEGETEEASEANWSDLNGYNTSYGELIEQFSTDIFIKNQDGEFIAFDYANGKMSPKFEWCRDLETWLKDNT